MKKEKSLLLLMAAASVGAAHAAPLASIGEGKRLRIYTLYNRKKL